MQILSNDSVFMSERVFIKLSDVMFVEYINNINDGHKLNSCLVSIGGGLRISLTPEEATEFTKILKKYYGIKES